MDEEPQVARPAPPPPLPAAAAPEIAAIENEEELREKWRQCCLRVTYRCRAPKDPQYLPLL